MSKLIQIMLLAALSGLPAGVYAAQTCRSESEIPASTPTARFSDHANGTLTDTQTGLMWAKCAEGLSGAECATGSANTYTWEGALNIASASTLAGYTDWRLPNIKELRSIVEGRCKGPAINLMVFPNELGVIFWSASPSAFHSIAAWGVDFGAGDSDGNGRSSTLRVRLVRSGQ